VQEFIMSVHPALFAFGAVGLAGLALLLWLKDRRDSKRQPDVFTLLAADAGIERAWRTGEASVGPTVRLAQRWAKRRNVSSPARHGREMRPRRQRRRWLRAMALPVAAAVGGIGLVLGLGTVSP
jgi:hypothetical protein